MCFRRIRLIEDMFFLNNSSDVHARACLRMGSYAPEYNHMSVCGLGRVVNQKKK